MRALHIIAPFAEEIAAQLDRSLPGLEVRTANSLAEIDAELPGIEALAVFPGQLDQGRIDRMGKLRWLQALTSGLEALEGLDLGKVEVTSMAGIQGPQMAELAFLFMLGLRRDFRGILARQARKEWRPSPQPGLAGSHAVIVGTGHVAQAIAARCRAFEMRVTGISRSPRAIAGFDRIVAREELANAAREADFLIVATALDVSSRMLVSAEVIHALPADAALINIARGNVVDEAALLEALRNGAIAGAGLDVFGQEPLPRDSGFWGLPNVLITPHIGGWSTSSAARMAEVIAANAGRRLAND